MENYNMTKHKKKVLKIVKKLLNKRKMYNEYKIGEEQNCISLNDYNISRKESYSFSDIYNLNKNMDFGRNIIYDGKEFGGFNDLIKYLNEGIDLIEVRGSLSIDFKKDIPHIQISYNTEIDDSVIEKLNIKHRYTGFMGRIKEESAELNVKKNTHKLVYRICVGRYDVNITEEEYNSIMDLYFINNEKFTEEKMDKYFKQFLDV
jgi:hypothetical protein